MKSKLEQLQDFLDGTADRGTMARIEAELRAPKSELFEFFEVVRERAERFGPTDIDWSQFFEADDEDAGDTRAVGIDDSAEEGVTEGLDVRKEGHWREKHDEDVAVPPNEAFSWTRLGINLAIAASLLSFGVFLGRYYSPNGGRPTGIELVSAEATTMHIPGRDPSKLSPAIEILSEMSGFATIVSLAPDRRALVRPSLGGGDYPVAAGQRDEPLILPDDTTSAVFVVTETPSGEPLRRIEDELRSCRPGDETSVRKVLQQVLEQKGYRRMAFGEATFTTEN